MTSNTASQQQDAREPESVELIKGCLYCLGQCQQLLQQISAAHYQAASSGQSSVGAHLRHVLERFQSFLNGLPDGQIDYDARQRDGSLEQNPGAAGFALNSINRRLQDLPTQLARQGSVLVTESVHPGLPAVQAVSSAQRELMSLISHSVHHLAIIAMLIRPLGYQVDETFGKAPSTVIHESRQ